MSNELGLASFGSENMKANTDNFRLKADISCFLLYCNFFFHLIGRTLTSNMDGFMSLFTDVYGKMRAKLFIEA